MHGVGISVWVLIAAIFVVPHQAQVMIGLLVICVMGYILAEHFIQHKAF